MCLRKKTVEAAHNPRRFVTLEARDDFLRRHERQNALAGFRKCRRALAGLASKPAYGSDRQHQIAMAIAGYASQLLGFARDLDNHPTPKEAEQRAQIVRLAAD